MLAKEAQKYMKQLQKQFIEVITCFPEGKYISLKKLSL
jgi:hypothetical protein